MIQMIQIIQMPRDQGASPTVRVSAYIVEDGIEKICNMYVRMPVYGEVVRLIFELEDSQLWIGIRTSCTVYTHTHTYLSTVK
jgi:hypothetical protein